MQPLRLARSFLPERPPEMTAIPVGARGNLGSGKPPIKTVPGKRGPAQQFRLRLWAKRKKTTANEPGHSKMFGWRAGRRFRISARRCGY